MALEPEETIVSQARLRELIPLQDSRNVIEKDMGVLNHLALAFIALSPFTVIATKGKDGLIDTSPRGDPAGFVEVYDSTTLILPDRLGNQRADTYENILHDPSVGLIFLIPGQTETLRVAGQGRIVRDAAISARLAVNGREPLLVLVVDVKQVFMHGLSYDFDGSSARIEPLPVSAKMRAAAVVGSSLAWS